MFVEMLIATIPAMLRFRKHSARNFLTNHRKKSHKSPHWFFPAHFFSSTKRCLVLDGLQAFHMGLALQYGGSSKRTASALLNSVPESQRYQSRVVNVMLRSK